MSSAGFLDGLLNGDPVAEKELSDNGGKLNFFYGGREYRVEYIHGNMVFTKIHDPYI